MRFIRFAAALCQTFWQRRESPLLLYGVTETARQLAGKDRLKLTAHDLQRGEPLHVRLPFGFAAEMGHEYAGRYLYQVIADNSLQLETRQSALTLLCGLQHEDRLSQLLGLGQQWQPEIRESAIRALGAFGKELYYHANILQAMLLAETEPEPMAGLIGLLFEANRTLLPSLKEGRCFWTEVITHPNLELKTTGIRVVGKHQAEGTEYVPLFSALLVQETEATVKCALVRALGLTIVEQSDAVVPIAQCINDPNFELADAAFDALAALGPIAAPAAPHLTLALLGKDGWRKERAAETLKAIGLPDISGIGGTTTNDPTTLIVALDRLIWAKHEMPVTRLLAWN